MLMQHKIKKHSVNFDEKIALCVQESQAEVSQHHLWEVIVQMHYLAHELRDPGVTLAGLSPAYTRLVAGMLSEWAILAETAAREHSEASKASGDVH